MSEVQVRPFRRPDREQLTALVNAHIQAVVPGVSVSVNTVMSQLERDPGEFIVDPWVAERTTMVAEQRGRVVAAAHLLRYGTGRGGRQGHARRRGGQLAAVLAGGELLAGLGGRGRAPSWRPAWPSLRRWEVTHWSRRRRAARARRVRRSPSSGRTSGRCTSGPGSSTTATPRSCSSARVDELPRAAGATHPRPAAGSCRSASTARGSTGPIDDKLVGYIEVETNLAEGGRLAHLGGWADVGNLHVDEAYRRRGVATWLVGQAADWLRLARVERLLEYAWPEEEALLGAARPPRLPRAHPHRPRLASPPGPWPTRSRRSVKNRSVR